MPAAEYIVERANRLKAKQAHWDDVRQQASTELLAHANELAADPQTRAVADDEQERLRSQISDALAQLQELAKELAQLSEHLKVEALRQEEQQKADAQQKEQNAKEFFEKKDHDRLEALAKEDQVKQEALAKEEQTKQEALEKAERDKQPPPPEQSAVEFLTVIAAEWQYVLDEIAAEWDYVDQEIAKEMEYNVSQALEAVAEAAFLVGYAIADPVSQKEGKEFLNARTQELANFIDDEVFDTAPAAHKAMQLEHKFNEQLAAEKEAFGDRKDDLGIRKLTQEGLAELHGTLRDAVKLEQEQEKKLHASIDALEEMHAETRARLEKAGYRPEILEEKTQQLDAVLKQEEQKLRDAAEEKRQALSQKLESELRSIADDKCRQMEGQDAQKRKEAEEIARETYRSL